MWLDVGGPSARNVPCASTQVAVVRTQHAFLHYCRYSCVIYFGVLEGLIELPSNVCAITVNVKRPGLMDFRAKQDIQQENKCKQVLFLSSGNWLDSEMLSCLCMFYKNYKFK